MSVEKLNRGMIRFKDFINMVGEQLKHINPHAYAILMRMKEGRINDKLLADFIWEYDQDIHKAHPDAFGVLLDVAQSFGIMIS